MFKGYCVLIADSSYGENHCPGLVHFFPSVFTVRGCWIGSRVISNFRGGLRRTRSRRASIFFIREITCKRGPLIQWRLWQLCIGRRFHVRGNQQAQAHVDGLFVQISWEKWRKRCANIDPGSEPSGSSTAEFLAALITCESFASYCTGQITDFSLDNIQQRLVVQVKMYTF